ncbi:hypothetical protein [Microbispora sp. GKU 823]|uniref:hypothetical protein n=1 Tax=Microbispora sp. GKU 823 TaxID=1652100 RepID=UPI0015C426CB|nr:hypothetical protein [Microbispora sp. GKU 823]
MVLLWMGNLGGLHAAPPRHAPCRGDGRRLAVDREQRSEQSRDTAAHARRLVDFLLNAVTAPATGRE